MTNKLNEKRLEEQIRGIKQEVAKGKICENCRFYRRINRIRKKASCVKDKKNTKEIINSEGTCENFYYNLETYVNLPDEEAKTGSEEKK